ncbi:hypothetical protein Hanom_Chr05g00385791 [Helianthus anomalus]
MVYAYQEKEIAKVEKLFEGCNIRSVGRIVDCSACDYVPTRTSNRKFTNDITINICHVGTRL